MFDVGVAGGASPALQPNVNLSLEPSETMLDSVRTGSAPSTANTIRDGGFNGNHNRAADR